MKNNGWDVSAWLIFAVIGLAVIFALAGCSGGSGESGGKGIEPVVKAAVPHSGAWNSPRNYVREDS